MFSRIHRHMWFSGKKSQRAQSAIKSITGRFALFWIQRKNGGARRTYVYQVGPDVPKQTVNNCRKGARNQIHPRRAKSGAPGWELDMRVRTLAQSRMVAMEATIFTGGINDHLLSHAGQMKVPPSLMLPRHRRG